MCFSWLYRLWEKLKLLIGSSQPSSLGLPQHVDAKEEEMLRDLYVVLWAVRERIREVVRRQEIRKRLRSRPLVSSPRSPELDARSPL
ncbi:uncharacterized protein C7orf61 homolog isoform X2 [Vombatus ursinus]|uniref:uncharacterized protein C7orf61 homolog isoform X2 n=1 Tax=Vombatus ursinus TaxID=29139 RepID=UPI000FFD362C|nr:uncharacterized protein C7orf61 homolog isoform X2 [Vombatus ursinus]XP_027704303.1 uncharacterized protein C7orf61 homolog isoform X2 [Vombatus ursinus]